MYPLLHHRLESLTKFAPKWPEHMYDIYDKREVLQALTRDLHEDKDSAPRGSSFRPRLPYVPLIKPTLFSLPFLPFLLRLLSCCSYVSLLHESLM